MRNSTHKYRDTKITKESKHVSLFAIYRPESNNSTMKAFFNEFEDLLEKASVI